VEVLHLYTLFPLPVEIIQAVARRCEFILIPELNLGQYAREVRKMAENWTTVSAWGKSTGPSSALGRSSTASRSCGQVREHLEGC